MTQDEAIKLLLEAKEKRVELFLYATTTENVELRTWNGHDPVETNIEKRVIPAGTRVLITTASKQGTIGIRDEDLDPPSVGYYVRVLPKVLKDWSASV